MRPSARTRLGWRWPWTGRFTIASIALAHRIGAVMLTADLRFVAAVASTEHGESVKTLADCAGTQ